VWLRSIGNLNPRRECGRVQALCTLRISNTQRCTSRIIVSARCELNFKERRPFALQRPAHLFWPLNNRDARGMAFVNQSGCKRITFWREAIGIGVPDWEGSLVFGDKQEGR
jgi:hypothetical protein